ncbi:uncharacterized protein [Montipora capricornis]|uniref:uncharacterized protein n=1 Tax=Montipora capricornis TaxID=246305 RepID=UPI0035F1001D
MNILLSLFLVRGENNANKKAPFRKWCGLVGEIRSLLPGVPLLVLTATATAVTRKKIMTFLSFNHGIEIVFKEEVLRALSKGKVAVKDFSSIVDNWRKVIPNLICMLGDNDCQEDNLCINFVSDEGKARILSKLVEEDKARVAVEEEVLAEV